MLYIIQKKLMMTMLFVLEVYLFHQSIRMSNTFLVKNLILSQTWSYQHKMLMIEPQVKHMHKFLNPSNSTTPLNFKTNVILHIKEVHRVEFEFI